MKSAADLFSLQLGVRLWLLKFGITGWFSDLLTAIATKFLGSLLDYGIFGIDITVNAIEEGMKKAEFKDLALKAHNKAIAKVYTEEEKNAIRQQYLDLLGKFVAFGNGVPKHP